MCSPYFRRFPELPTELRLQIWQDACLVLDPSHCSLQYVTVQENEYDQEAVAIPCNWPSWPRSLSQNTNRSAYFIHGGLWKACKESREVIVKHTEYQKWLQIHTQAIQDSKELVRRQRSSSCADLIRKLEGLRLDRTRNSQPSSSHGPPPAIIDYDEESGEECRILVYPSRDMFCIRVDDWHSIRGARHPDIKMPFIRYNDDDKHYVEFFSNREYQRRFKQPELQNISLEFDTSWMIDIPFFVGDMRYENSARGYLADWLAENASPWLDVEGSLSIIDNEAKWFARGPVNTVYRDFDTEYVKVSWDDVADYTCEGVYPSAYAFVQKIRHYMYDIQDTPDSPDAWYAPWRRDIEDIISLLVRRDNEVKEPIWSCPGKCDRNGWCICSGDKTKRRQGQEDPDASLRHLMETVSLREWNYEDQDV